jgi:hypothetical protein
VPDLNGVVWRVRYVLLCTRGLGFVSSMQQLGQFLLRTLLRSARTILLHASSRFPNPK